MSDIKINNEDVSFIRTVCADLDEKEAQEAQATFYKYLEIAVKIYERISRENIHSQDFDSDQVEE